MSVSDNVGMESEMPDVFPAGPFPLLRRIVLPADGSEQGGAGLVVEGDDDAGRGEVSAVDQQGASGGGKA